MAIIVPVWQTRFPCRSVGGSILFNGTSDYATLPIFLEPSQSGFSVSFFVKVTGWATSANSYIVGATSTGSTNGFIVRIPQNTNKFNFYIENSGAVVDIDSPTINLNQWYHVAIVFSPNNAVLYLNGIPCNSDTNCTLGSVIGTITLGKASHSSTQYFKGFISEFVFQNGIAWTQDQVQAVFKKGISAVNATASFNFNNNVSDQSGNGNDLSLNGTAYSIDVPCYARTTMSNRLLLRNMGKSLSFNGSSDFFTYPIAPSITGFNIGFWLNTNPVVLTNKIICNWQTASAQDGFSLRMATGTSIQLIAYNNTTLEVNILSNISRGWHYIVFTYANNSAKLYIDNVLVGQDTSISMTAATGQLLTFSRLSFNASANCVFLMDDLTIENNTPWSTSIMNNLFYRRIKPSGVSWYNFNDNVTDQSGLGNNLTLTGTSYSTIVPITTRSLA